MMQVRQLRDGRYRITLWHHSQPYPDDEERYDLILERSIPVIVLRETFTTKSETELIKLCVENTLVAYGLVAQKKAGLALWGTFAETAPGKYSLEEDMSFWMRVFGKPLKVWNVTAPRSGERKSGGEIFLGRGIAGELVRDHHPHVRQLDDAFNIY